jgi:hypothetical protein
VEQQSNAHDKAPDLEKAYYAAMDAMWELIRGSFESRKGIYTWAISDFGSLSIMYWCFEAMYEGWWQSRYDMVPRHFHQRGWLKIREVCYKIQDPFMRYP